MFELLLVGMYTFFFSRVISSASAGVWTADDAMQTLPSSAYNETGYGARQAPRRGPPARSLRDCVHFPRTRASSRRGMGKL